MKTVHQRRKWNCFWGVGLGILASLVSQPAQALTFNFNFEETVTQDVKDAVEEAGSIWSSYLKDDVVLNVDIGFGGISQGYLGGARPEMVRVDYGDVVTQLGLDQTSSDDASALLNLPTYQKDGDLYVNRLINGTTDGFFGAWHEDKSVDSLWITRANAKALGVIASDSSDTTSDAQIRFGDWASWDFSSEKIKSDKYDFVGVALHELGHTLGFMSGVDVLDYYLKQGIFNSDQDYDYVTTADLFRKSSLLKNKDVIDWTVDSSEEYFSVDGGDTAIAMFSNGAANIRSLMGKDDGFQISHWAVGEDGVMRPSLSTGERNSITGIDLRLLDAIGWDLDTRSQVDYQNSDITHTLGEGAFDSALGWGSGSTQATSWSFWQEGSYLAAGAATPQSTPEGSGALGLLILGGLGHHLYRKRKSAQ